ncbi:MULTISPECIES: sugar ABC transporter ATP-binding protein [unclassified Nocardioides]|uniref:sugar ABC transporter ATP-binding protein n=1 Tax=unclassified Nocardioides TaxID=2615069 RepID=UPI00005707DF|nr:MULTISPECIES: sugar ABC transporter ATP-binding protein [unclassified Nocardioides]ABL80332.1 monosaccharide ABC transporter ATP-binding protein, CUT2 family [Nocardioides sp. JS614]
MDPIVKFPDSPSAALEVSGVEKVYGGNVALAGVSLSVGQGEIHGLLGANGAGKSTLVKIISGIEPQDAGTVSILGAQLPLPHHPSAVRELGCALIHQDRALAPDLSIADNIALTVGYTRRWGLIDNRATTLRAREATARVGLSVDVSTLVSDLPIAEQTLVAIARALAVDARLVLLDEPTANLGREDAHLLYGRLRALADDGVACVLITHALSEALEVCDRVTVLRDGEVVASQPASELSPDQLATLVVGHRPAHHVSERRKRSGSAAETPRLSLAGLTHDRFGPLTLDAFPGEVIGITGLADSGHLQVCEVVAGLARASAGTMRVDGTEYAPSGVAHARGRHIAYVPPDRLRDGLASSMSARENLYLDGRSPKRERSESQRIMRDAKVKPADPEAHISTFSGGNQQKVLIAKWMETEPSLLVLSEPTVGVDIGARDDIYSRIHQSCAEGRTVLVASSDLEEISLLSDRVIVLRYGQVVAELESEEATVERLAALSS